MQFKTNMKNGRATEIGSEKIDNYPKQSDFKNDSLNDRASPIIYSSLIKRQNS